MPGTGHTLVDPPFRSVGALLDEYRRRTPHKDAIVDVERNATIRFGELAAIHFAADENHGDAPLPVAGDIDDIASMCCTSGTTGMPKVVVYDHACYWFNGLDSIDLLGLNPDDRALEYRSFDWYSAQILS